MRKQLCLIAAFVFLLCGCADNSVSSATSSDAVMTEPTQCMAVTTQPVTEITEPICVFDPMDFVEKMTDEELVGQLFLVRCPGGKVAIDDISRLHLGGVVLFGNDFEDETPQSVTETIQAYQEAASVPLLVAVDEEGGTVTRVSRYAQFRSENFDSPRKLFEKGGIDAIIETEQEKCELLKSLGINVNLGPVCDITQNPGSFMYDRSLGQDPQITAEFVSAVVDITSTYQVGSVLKHFPGYGNNVDTHYGIAVDHRPLSELESVDLVPFSVGIAAGCDCIMISHTYVNSIDAPMPASLSGKVVGYLRNNVDFNGVIMTDDLAMDAISQQYGTDESAILAVEAGVDMLCSTDYPKQYQAVLNALKDGRISRTQLIESACRIILWKHELGIL